MQNHVYESLIPFLSAAIAAGLALLVMARSRRSWVHWSFAAALGALALAQVGNGFSLLAESPSDVLQWRRVALIGEVLMPLGWLVFSLTFARSNARDLVRDWRGGLLTSATITLLCLALSGSDAMFRLVSVPESGAYFLILGPIGQLYASLYLIAQVLVLANLEQTLRHADEHARWYLKFPVVGLGLLCAFFLYQMSDLLLYSVWHAELAWLSAGVAIITCALIGYGMLHRPMPDVQIYVSRRIVSSSLTFLIVGGMLTLTGLVASIIRYSGLPGGVVLSILFVFLALTGLVLLLLSATLRQALSRFVERHFFPHKYDYRARWMDVTEAIGGSGTAEQIGWRVLQLLKGIFGARSLTIWLASESEGEVWRRIAAHNVAGSSGRLRGSGEVRRWLEAMSGPCRLDGVERQRLQVPYELDHLLQDMAASLIVPLKGGRQAIGWVALSRAGDGTFTQQDLDLLRCIAAQVGDRLQHLLLSDRLAMAREMEAFYQYSAFLLHDLKNFTATLSLVVQNAVRHGSDPEFQRAAMSTVGATVRKMAALTGTLGAMSRDPHPRPALLDLNGMVEEVLRSFNGAAVAQLVHEPGPVPPVEADSDQIQQVLLNLILNAQEAVGEGGRITIRTFLEGSTVSLIVEDNGCGMDRMTAAGLFRPFRTTKGRGLGIGLYQCKKIIAAHQGELEVDSEMGKGSRFIVRLPATQVERVEAHA
jgi:putative PEP-CTERM system histidine kinase